MKQLLNNVISEMYIQSLQGNKNSIIIGLIYLIGGQFLFLNSILYTHYKLLLKINKLEPQLQNLIEFFQYLNPHFYQNMCYSISIIDLLILVILTGFFTSIILTLYKLNNNKQYKIIKKFYGQVLIKTFDFLVLFGFYPMILILLSVIRCIYTNVDQIYLVNEYFIICLSILSIFGYFGILIISIFHSCFYFNEWNKKKDSLTRKQGYIVFINTFIKNLLLTIIIFEIDDIQYYIFLIYLFVIFSIILIMININELNFCHYQSKIIRSTFVQSILIQFSISFSLLLNYYFNIKPIFFIIIIYGLTYFIYNSILRKIQINYCFIKPKNLLQLQLKLQAFLEYQKHNQILNQVGDLIYFGEIYHHLANNCNNQLKEFGVRCFCSMKIMFDAKIQKDVRKNVQAISHNRSTFKKLLIKSYYEISIQNNLNDINLRFQYAQFLYFKMNNKLQALYQIKHIYKKKMNLYTQLRIQQLLNQTKEDLINLNSQSYYSFLDFEYVIEMEETVSKIYQEMMKIVNQYIQFWRKLSKFPQFEDIQIKINSDINQSIHQCEQYWNHLKKHEIRIKQQDIILSYLHKKQKWLFLNFWYRLFILNKKIRISQLENNSSSHLRQDMINEDSDSDYEVKIYEQFVNLKPFNHLSIIIHSLLNGQIINQSQTCKEILEYDNLKSIYQIIPNTFQRNHQIAIKNLINNGKSKNLYKSKRIFIKHSQGYILQARKYLKWYLNLQNQPVTIAMIRPIIRLEQINFIILNGDWEVDTVTRPLLSILEKNTCLLLLCTGLFQFSQFSQLLEIEDKSRFKLNQGSRTLSFNQSQQYNTNNNEQDCVNTQSGKSAKINSQENFFQELDDQTYDMFANNDVEYFNDTFNRKFFKIVDEQHVKLTLRLPKRITQLNQEYQQLKQLTYQDIIQNTQYSSGLQKRKKNRLVIRNNQGKLIINKLILFRKLYDFKQKMIRQMYENLKDLFDRYCSQNKLLEKLIKLDASIHFTKSITMDKFTIIKINKYEIFEYHQKQFRETHNVLSESRVRQSRPSLVELYMDNRILQQQINNSEVDSNRIDQNKSFLTEGQIFPEFITFHPTEVVLKLESNIFLKQDNNKLNKKFQEISLFLFFNRLMIFTLFLLTIIGFLKGPSINFHQTVLIELEEIQNLKKFMISIIQTYEYTLDNYLYQNYNQNITSISFDEYQEKRLQTLKNNYKLINDSFSQIEFIEIYYGYEILDNPINDLLSQYMVNLHYIQLNDINEINKEYDILKQLRQIIIPIVKNGIKDSFIQKYNNVYNNLQENQNFAAIEIILSICFLLLYLISNNLLIINIIKKNKQIIRSLKLLSKKKIQESLSYVSWLKVQLKFLIDLEANKFLNAKTQQSSYCEQLSKYDDSSITSKQKNQTFIESKIWIKITIQIMFSYLFLYCIITISLLYYQIFLFTFQSGTLQLFNSNNFLKYSEYIYSMVLIKELFIYQQKDQQIDSINDISQSLENFVSQVNNFNDETYQTDIEDISNMFFGNYCDYIQGIKLYNKDQTCEFKLNGAFTRGLNQYNLMLSQIAIALQNQKDNRFDYPTINKIYEFSDQFQFVYDISEQSLNIWCNTLTNYVENQIYQDLIYIIIMLVFSGLVYIIFIEIILIKTLRKQYKQSLKYVNRYYSNDVLNSQKNIRVIFVRLGLIQK